MRVKVWPSRYVPPVLRQLETSGWAQDLERLLKEEFQVVGPVIIKYKVPPLRCTAI